MQLLKEEVDDFGSRKCSDSPPTYLIAIYAEKTEGTKPSLKYIIAMTGVKKEKEICIVRHLEYVKTDHSFAGEQYNYMNSFIIIIIKGSNCEIIYLQTYKIKTQQY